MTNNGSSTAPFIFEVDNASTVLFGDFSMGDRSTSRLSSSISGGGCQNVTVHDCVLFDTGEQLIKGNPTLNGSSVATNGAVNNSVVEYCQFKYHTTAAPPARNSATRPTPTPSTSTTAPTGSCAATPS